MNQDSWFKRTILRANQYFRQKEQERVFKIDPENHIIDRKLGTVKNLLRLSNKTLIGFQKVWINKLAIFASAFGLGLGYISAELDDAITYFKQNYRKVIRQLLISKVLKDHGIKMNLDTTLLQNVFKNVDVQYNLHQVLMNKAIKPQEKDLFELSKRGIIQALRNRQIRKQLAVLAAKGLKENENVVGKLALQFLGGHVMDKILSAQLSKLLASEEVNEEVAEEAKKGLKRELGSKQNKEKIYKLMRQKLNSL